jgi:hypothetical protein
MIILAIWLGLAMMVIAAGLRISRPTGPDRYAVMRTIEEARTKEAPDHPGAA